MSRHPLHPIVEDLLKEIHRQNRIVQRAIDRDDESYATAFAKLEGLRLALNIVLRHKDR
jgi:hypothetical protein